MKTYPYAVPVEKWPSLRYILVTKWLEDTFGVSNNGKWSVRFDHDLMDLIMAEDVYAMYLLRWS